MIKSIFFGKVNSSIFYNKLVSLQRESTKHALWLEEMHPRDVKTSIEIGIEDGSLDLVFSWQKLLLTYEKKQKTYCKVFAFNIILSTERRKVPGRDERLICWSKWGKPTWLFSLERGSSHVGNFYSN